MDPCLVPTRFSSAKLAEELARSLMDQSRSRSPGAGTAGKEFQFYILADVEFLVNVPPPLMRVNPAAVGDRPGGFGSH